MGLMMACRPQVAYCLGGCLNSSNLMSYDVGVKDGSNSLRAVNGQVSLTPVSPSGGQRRGTGKEQK